MKRERSWGRDEKRELKGSEHEIERDRKRERGEEERERMREYEVDILIDRERYKRIQCQRES